MDKISEIFEKYAKFSIGLFGEENELIKKTPLVELWRNQFKENYDMKNIHQHVKSSTFNANICIGFKVYFF